MSVQLNQRTSIELTNILYNIHDIFCNMFIKIKLKNNSKVRFGVDFLDINDLHTTGLLNG